MSSLFDRFKEGLSRGRDALAAEVSKYKNAAFMEATVACCAIIAVADGTVSPEEKRKMAEFMQRSQELRHFEMGRIIEVFKRFTDAMEFDIMIGRAEALRAVGKLKSRPAEARLLVRVACAIGASDGNFDAAEKAAAFSICRELGLDPAEFGL